MSDQRLQVFAVRAVGGKEFGPPTGSRQALHAVVSPVFVAADDDRVSARTGQRFAVDLTRPENSRSADDDGRSSLHPEEAFEIRFSRHGVPPHMPERWAMRL